MGSIVHIVQNMGSGGIETLVFDLAARDPDVRVLSLEGTVESLAAGWPRLVELGTRFDALDKRPGAVPSLIRAIAERLKEWDAGAIVAHHIGPLIYGGLAAQLARIPVRIHVEHDAWHYENTSHARLARLFGAIVRPRRIAVSQGTADAATRATHLSRIEIVPNGVDLDRFRPRDKAAARRAFGLPESAVIVGSVGRLAAIKGHDVLLEAMSFLPKTLHCALAGDGERLDALRRQAAALDIADRVHLIGKVEAPEMIYPAFDLFCLPSRGEGFPRAVVEAQACNVAVVASDVGGVREALDPVTGRLVAPGHPVRLALAITTALEHPQGEPRAFVDPRFSLERTVDAYRSLAAGRQLGLAS